MEVSSQVDIEEEELSRLKSKLKRQYERAKQWSDFVKSGRTDWAFSSIDTTPVLNKASSSRRSTAGMSNQDETADMKGVPGNNMRKRLSIQQAKDLDAAFSSAGFRVPESQLNNFSAVLELPFSKQTSASVNWYRRQKCGKCAQRILHLLETSDENIQGLTQTLVGKYLITKELGRGGSGVVYAAELIVPDLQTGLQLGDEVAIKTAKYRGNMSTEEYLREGLIDVAFLCLAQCLQQVQACPVLAIFDVIYSSHQFSRKIRRNSTSTKPELSFVLQKVDGTMGRFATPEDDDYDPAWDTILLKPFNDCEIFQFLYLQLVYMTCLGYKVHDLMLSGQLRGDNIGFKELPEQEPGICFKLQNTHIFFPNPCSVLYFLDVGQGSQADVQALYERGLIGNPIVSSCIEDDGMGRYWPQETLYTDMRPSTDFGKEVIKWAAGLRIETCEDAYNALPQLFSMYAATGYAKSAMDPVVLSSKIWDCSGENLQKAKAINPLKTWQTVEL